MMMSSSYHTDSSVCHVPKLSKQPIVNQREVNTLCISKEPVVTMPSQLVPGSTYQSKVVTIYYQDDIDNPLVTADPEIIEWVEGL